MTRPRESWLRWGTRLAMAVAGIGVLIVLVSSFLQFRACHRAGGVWVQASYSCAAKVAP